MGRTDQPLGAQIADIVCRPADAAAVADGGKAVIEVLPGGGDRGRKQLHRVLAVRGGKPVPKAGKVGVQVDQPGRQRPPAAVKSRFPFRKGFQAGHHLGDVSRLDPDDGFPFAVPAESRRKVQMVQQQSDSSLPFLFI